MLRTVVVTVVCLAVWSGLSAQEYDRLIPEAEGKYSIQEYEEALDLYREAFQEGDGSLSDFYNAACTAAIAGEPDIAFTYLDKAMAASFPDAHPNKPVVDLPEPRLTGDVSVEEALQGRRSMRAYTDLPLTLTEISQLLWAAYGLNKPIEGAPEFLRGGLRTAPSAGALYPLEVYLVARNVTGLAPGIYWYKSETHQLISLEEGDLWQEVTDAGLNQPHFETASAAIVYSAVFERNTRKYGERGRERYVCMDLGHSAENVYLQAYALKIGTCAIGAFSDLALKQAIGMTKEEEPLYIMPIGKVE